MMKPTNKNSYRYVLKSLLSEFSVVQNQMKSLTNIPAKQSTKGGAFQVEEMTENLKAGMSLACLGTERRPVWLEYSKHGGQ